MSEALEKFNYLVEILGEIFNSEKTLDVVEEGAQEIKPKGLFKKFIKEKIITKKEKKDVEEQKKVEEKKGKLERKQSISELVKNKFTRVEKEHEKTLKLFNKIYDITCDKQPSTCGGMWYYCISKIPKETIIKSCDMKVKSGVHEDFCKEIKRIKEGKRKLRRKSSAILRTNIKKTVNEFKNKNVEMKVMFTFIMVPYEYYYYRLDEANEGKPKYLRRKSFLYIGREKYATLDTIKLSENDYILITNVINDNACVGILYNEKLLLKYGFPEEFNRKIDETKIGEGLLPQKKFSSEENMSDEEFKNLFKIQKIDDDHYEFYINEKNYDKQILFNTERFLP